MKRDALCNESINRRRSVPTSPNFSLSPPFRRTIQSYRTLPIVTHRAYIDIEMDDSTLGRIVFGLFGEIAPKAVENFVALCNCDHGKGKLTGKDLCYKNSPIHRVIPNFGLQGGDFTHFDGRGGESIYQNNVGTYFNDEALGQVKHNRAYMVSNVNDGKGKKNTNRSQFFINTVKTQWLDKTHQIFGMILEGKSVITEIEKVGTHGGIPTKKIMIVNSGTLPIKPDVDSKPRLISEKLEL